MTDAPKNNSILYIVLAAVGGLALGLAISLLGGGVAPAADAPTEVVEITPEAAAAAGYVPKPTYRVIEKAEADKLVKGMTLAEVQDLFPDVSIVTSAASVQPLPHSEGNSWVSESVSIGLSPEGQIQATFSNGQLTSWGWATSADETAFREYSLNRLILAIQQGGDAEGALF